MVRTYYYALKSDDIIQERACPSCRLCAADVHPVMVSQDRSIPLTNHPATGISVSLTCLRAQPKMSAKWADSIISHRTDGLPLPHPRKAWRRVARTQNFGMNLGGPHVGFTCGAFDLGFEFSDVRSSVSDFYDSTLRQSTKSIETNPPSPLS